MAIFVDADVQHHARRAVQTALELLDRTAQLNTQLTGINPIAIHIGINSGLALVGPTKLEGASGTRWTYTALGQVTNVAARIAAIGEAGAILVGPETAQRIAGFFSIHEVGMRQFKNISDAVMVYRILGYL